MPFFPHIWFGREFLCNTKKQGKGGRYGQMKLETFMEALIKHKVFFTLIVPAMTAAVPLAP